jgi:uncharacterized membrane protein
MKPDNDERREQIIAALLWYGTWLASTIITVGIIVGTFQRFGTTPGPGFNSYNIVKAGVALFIFLPIARVALMLMIFLRERDYIYTAISALVLSIITIGILIRFPG